MKDNTEERALPPTPKKLVEARKKGQIFHSSDMVVAATTCAVLLLVWLSIGGLVDWLRAAFNGFGETSALPFHRAAATLASTLANGTVPFLTKLVLAVVAVSILANLVIAGGFLFAVEPMKPKADNINPVEGLKRMFALQGLIEFVKSLLKTLLLATCCISIELMSVNAILRAPACGLGGLGPLFAATTRPLVVGLTHWCDV
jgi:type III secretion protein U